MKRPSHNHITQSRSPVPGCPACALIRPQVMTAPIGLIAGGIYGPPPTPKDTLENRGQIKRDSGGTGDGYPTVWRIVGWTADGPSSQSAHGKDARGTP